MASASSVAVDVIARPVRIAVAGNPNCGKTSIFNQLTGLRQKVANYPGVTVEKREGTLADGRTILLDLPGTYSLSARSPDEEIARDVLLARIPGIERPDVILLVIDAANLERNLYLATQILEFGTPVIIACNMMDVARERGIAPDCDALSRELGVPVIPTVGRDGTGLDALREALHHPPRRQARTRAWRLDEPFELAAERIAAVMTESGAVPDFAVRGGSLLWLMDYLSGEERARASAERFLNKLLPAQADVLRATADELARAVKDASATAIEARYAWISQLVQRVCRPAGDAQRRESPTDRIDRIVTHRVFGLAIFAGIMFVLFLSIFWLAEPLMGAIEAGQIALADAARRLIPEGAIQSLVADGVIAGVGAVVIFFPQICILFFFLCILEDTGYMARAAFLMDRLMSRVGLHGKSFIPLLSSYACAIPGILATRTIESPRDRLTTILVAPLMSCSARLPVYVILIAAVFGDRPTLKAGVLFALYFTGTAAALLLALVFKITLFKGPAPVFILELPPYHRPRLFSVLRTMWDRSKTFLTGAGTTIVAVCVVVWALGYFPRLDRVQPPADVTAKLAALPADDIEAREHLLDAEQQRQSVLGRMGRAIEPVIEPLGYDWRIGVGILSSFLAREVFVGTMGVTFALGEADESSDALRDKLAGATWPDGRPLLTPLSAASLLVFYVLACQCIATLAVVRKETGGWKWPTFMFGYMTLLAYGASFCINQVGHAIGNNW